MSSAHFSILFEVDVFLYVVTNMFFLCILIHFAHLCECDALYASTQSKAAALKCILRIVFNVDTSTRVERVSRRSRSYQWKLWASPANFRSARLWHGRLEVLWSVFEFIEFCSASLNADNLSGCWVNTFSIMVSRLTLVAAIWCNRRRFISNSLYIYFSLLSILLFLLKYLTQKSLEK